MNKYQRISNPVALGVSLSAALLVLVLNYPDSPKSKPVEAVHTNYAERVFHCRPTQLETNISSLGNTNGASIKFDACTNEFVWCTNAYAEVRNALTPEALLCGEGSEGWQMKVTPIDSNPSWNYYSPSNLIITVSNCFVPYIMESNGCYLIGFKQLTKFTNSPAMAKHPNK